MIKETTDYILQVADAINPINKNVTQAYQILNKVTKVVEIETTILPEAIDLVVNFQNRLDSQRSQRSADDAKAATLAYFDEGSNVKTLQ